MFVGSRFPGDTNGILMKVQSDLYGELLGFLYGYPRERYLGACRLVQSSTELAKMVETETSFDHRTLQRTHDLIAAWFRFLQKEKDGRTLFETEESYRKRLASEWRVFFESEVRSLSADDDFVRAVLTAAAFSNPDKAGVTAESQLDKFLKERYGAMERSAS
jgi:hypothetical protein